MPRSIVRGASTSSIESPEPPCVDPQPASGKITISANTARRMEHSLPRRTRTSSHSVDEPAPLRVQDAPQRQVKGSSMKRQQLAAIIALVVGTVTVLSAIVNA